MNISRMRYALLTLVALILSVTHVSAQINGIRLIRHT